MKSPILATMLLLVGFGTAAYAQDRPSPADEKVISECLSKASGYGYECIGKVADACVATTKPKPDEVNNDKTVMACGLKEMAIWSNRIDRSIATIKSKGGFKEIDAAVAKSQRPWKESVQALCAIYDPAKGAPPVEGGQSYCLLRETAARALTLKQLADYFKSNE